MKCNARKDAGGGGAPFAIPCVDVKSFVASLAFLTLFLAFWQLQPYGSLLTAARTSASPPCALLATTAAADLTSPNATAGAAADTKQPPADSGTTTATAAAAATNSAPVRLARN